MHIKKLPTLEYEIKLWKNGYSVMGIDEVGRGAFAGPLYVAGVIFNPMTSKKRLTRLLSYGINDSKKLSPKTRESLAKVIQAECLAYYISTIDVAEINRIGIGKATFKAMRDVVKNLSQLKQGGQLLNVKGQMYSPYVLVDGFYIKNLKGIGLNNQKAIVGGDGISLSIAAASIIAKVARDDYMRKLSVRYPEYMWEKNKGYGTLEHRNALRNHGATSLHRTAFIANSI